MQYTQDALFPDTDITGAGRLHPWPAAVEADTTEQAAPAQAETLPFDEDAA